MSRLPNTADDSSNADDHTCCPNCGFILQFTSISTDPARRLPFDCISLILQELDLTDLLRCEQLSKTWRDFVHTWIQSVGLHDHFPDAPALETEVEPEPLKIKSEEHGDDTRTADKSRLAEIENIRLATSKRRAVKLFRDTASILSGNPTAVRTIQASSPHVTVTGGYMAWLVDGDIYWESLFRGRNGALQRARKLKPRYIQENVEELVPIDIWVSRHCDILVRTREKNRGRLMDHLLDADTGKEIFYRDLRLAANGVPQTPLGFGPEQLYYFVSSQNADGSPDPFIEILKTEPEGGERWHQRVRGFIGPLVGQESFTHSGPRSISRKYADIVRLGGPQAQALVAVGVKGTLDNGDPAATGAIVFINADKGIDEGRVQVLQVDVPIQAHACIQVPASTFGEVALLSHDVDPLTMVTIRKFRADPDGKFGDHGIPIAVEWPWAGAPFKSIAIDAFNLLYVCWSSRWVFRGYDRLVKSLDIGPLTSCFSTAVQSPAESDASEEGVNKYLFGPPTQVTLPPREKASRSCRRPYRFLPDEVAHFEHAVHFIDPRRVIVEVSCQGYGKHPYTYRVLDFGKIL